MTNLRFPPLAVEMSEGQRGLTASSSSAHPLSFPRRRALQRAGRPSRGVAKEGNH